MKALENKHIIFYQYNDKGNIGDVISEVILKHFLPEYELELVNHRVGGKLCAVGSIMSKVVDGDILWGVGCIRRDRRYFLSPKTKILALRGALTYNLIFGNVEKPLVFGDPALLLPLIYNPKIEKIKGKIGYIPHYVDKPLFEGKEIIDVALPWQQFIDRVLECEEIVSSSLHGIVIAEAYGIPATWARYSNGVIGRNFKFHDYLTGTGRNIQGLGKFPPIPDLKGIQDGLIKSLRNFYDHC